MGSNFAKRSVVLRGHKTSVSLESQFWDCLKQIAQREGVSASALVTRIDTARGKGNLSSAIRLFVLQDMQARIPSEVLASAAHEAGGELTVDIDKGRSFSRRGGAGPRQSIGRR